MAGNRKITILATAFVALLAAFLTGYERANVVRKVKVATENIVTNEKTMPAKIIRAGDRGVLFLSIDTHRLQFIRWDAVKGIETL